MALTLIMFVPFLIMVVVLGVNGHFASSAEWVASMSFIPPFGTISWGVLVSTLVCKCCLAVCFTLCVMHDSTHSCCARTGALGGFDYVGALCGEDKGGPKIFFKGI